MILLSILLLAVLAIFIWIAKFVFKSLAFEVLEKTQEKGSQSLEAILAPLNESLKKIDGYQRELELRREGAYGGIKQQIETMIQTQKDLQKETQILASALHSPPVRGAWGQVHLRRVVELAGLVNHCDFFEQPSHEQEGKILRPDVIVHLPGKREIIIDAKTPLNAFLEAVSAPDEERRRQLLGMHAQHVRKHVKELSQKDYWKKLDLSPEFVVLFLPAEAFFSEALQVDASLIEVGAEQNVIVATPTTLIAILRAVAHSWKQETLARNAEQIAVLGQELYERLSVLSEHWSKVGRSLTASVDAYNQAISSLETRVFVTARKLKEQGAAPLLKKELDPLQPIDLTCRSLKN